ncbi:MAG: type II toxin-antitoxin system Phd/YefM family antitoxin [bacterium]|nr:type II toxin-antitoxin system Phd/YefM family antitoxin [bacterium]
MTKTVTSKYFRDHFSEMLNLVSYGGAEIIITRFGRPAVVVIDYKQYKEAIKLKKK